MAYGTQFTKAELDQLAEDFGEGAVEIEPGTTEVIETDTSDRTATMSIRLPVSMIAALKSAAQDEGVGATVLARRWIAERLAADGSLAAGTVDVSELLSFVAEHVRRAS